MRGFRIINEDVLDGLRKLPDDSVQCVVTSPPYWGLRDYGVDGQIGLEATPAEFLAKMVAAFREVRRVLRADGTCWVNMGDGYANNASTSAIPRNEQGNGTGSFQIPPEKHHEVRRAKPNRLTAMKSSGLKHKDLIGMPWRLAFALQEDGWWLRQDIIWSKPNPMPESVTDRCTKAHEYIFLLTKSTRYYYDAEAIKEDTVSDHASGNGFDGRQGGAEHMPMSGGEGTREQWQPGGKRNKRSVWEIATEAFSEAHFATFPTKLVEPCILAGSRIGDTVLDPFNGAGTTGLVALRLGREYVGVELNPEYAAMATRRIERDCPMFNVGVMA